MNDSLAITVTLFSYLICAWVAFKIFDYKKKGKQRDSKDDRLLWPLLLVIGLGGGSLLAYILKSWIGLA